MSVEMISVKGIKGTRIYKYYWKERGPMSER